LTDGQIGDAIVRITGGVDFLSGDSKNRGVAPGIDTGNQGDELAFVFGKNFVADVDSQNGFVSRVARRISRELGHCFGLADVQTDCANEVTRHHVMATGTGIDGTRDAVFADVPVMDVNFQLVNAHAELLRADVLGANTAPWMAVLKPGELTITG